MAKGQGKSSATSATRKKHARKAAGVQDELPLPKEKKPKAKDKKNAKEPKKKVFIPPVKPAPIQPDPLDTLGLVHSLPPELLVTLRNLKKKDTVTKTRALEDLQINWVEPARSGRDDGATTAVVVEMLPVWVRVESLPAAAQSDEVIFNDSYTTCLPCSQTPHGASACSQRYCTIISYISLQSSSPSSSSSGKLPLPTRSKRSSVHGPLPHMI
jgi:hypothetical protein